MHFTQYQKQHQQRYLDELFELLRIPSISALAGHQKDCRACANLLAQKLKEAGADSVKVYATKGNPIVYGEKIIDPKKPTVLIYGHYDVQPVEPLDLWHIPPFEPKVVKGEIRARGASDDKGQMYMHIKAFESLVQTKSLPLNIKFLIEGEEEIGCIHLESFLHTHKKKLAADLVLISDSAMLSLETPSIEIGLRGLCYMEIEIATAARDLHSGVYGGAVANPILVLSQMLASLHHKDGSVAIDGFYDNVNKLTRAERSKIANTPFDLAQFKKETGIKQPWGEKKYSTLERIGIRPTLEINGIWGGYIGEGAKTVLPAKAHAKLSCRLVPEQNSIHIGKLVAKHLQKITPREASLRVTHMHGGEPYVLQTTHPAYKAASMAIQKVLGKLPVPTRGGGSIPVVVDFEKHLGVKSLLLGFGLNNDNLHAPNEKLNVQNYYKGIEAISYFHEYYATTTPHT